MNLSAPFIKRPVMTTLAMTAIFVAGLICYYLLPISNLPDVNYPIINVKTTFPGALPETMANAIALPLEKQFMGISGLKIVSSTNTLGSSSLVLQFDIDKDMLEASQNVQEALSAAIPFLPPNLPYAPVYRKFNPAQQPVLFIGLTSPTLPLSELYTYANTLIGQRISMLPGVAQVTTYGSILAMRIQVDPVKLAAHGVTLPEVAAAVRQGNPILATGQLDGNVEAPLIFIDGQLLQIKDYEDLIVAYRADAAVRLRDIGRAVASFQNNKLFGQFVDEAGSAPTLVLAIQKEPNANTVELADGIYRLLDELKNQLPPAIETHIIFDRSIPVREAVHDATFTLLLALVLVVLVIYLFLGKIGDTIIPSLVLPISVFGTFIVMYCLKFTLDNLSLLALTIAAGFIIDDAVVVLENIIRRVEIGETPLMAALNGGREIGFTIVSMSLSLLAVFIPMLFMQGLIGKILKEFAITLSAITLISGVVSLTLTPMLCSLFIPPKNVSLPENFSKRLTGFMEKSYRRWLVKVFDHQFIALSLLLISLAATIYLLLVIPTDFVPDEDMGFFTIYSQGLEGTSSAHALADEDQIIQIVKNNPAVENFVAFSSLAEFRKGLCYVRLKPIHQRLPIGQVIQQMYKNLATVKGVQCFIKNVPMIDLAIGQESRAAYQYVLQGLHADSIYSAASALLNKMRQDSLFQGVNSDLSNHTPQIDVHIKRAQAASYGITAADVEQTFSLGYSGNLISLIQTPLDQYNVILELYPELQRQTSIFNQLWLRSPITSDLVPLSSLIQWNEALGSTSVNHINQFPSVTISFNLAPGVALKTALERLKELSADFSQQGVSALPIGAAQTFNESIKSAGYLLLIAVFSIYIILGILYESFLHPLTILTTLPPATFGGLCVLAAFNMPLSLYSFLGLILLLGIIKKNGIMVVDFALDNMRNHHMPAKEAIIDASVVRFRPIIMTTMAAICGVLPIALGFGANASARRPLGLVIIGGLCLSQLITLFVTPILFLALENLRPAKQPT